LLALADDAQLVLVLVLVALLLLLSSLPVESSGLEGGGRDFRFLEQCSSRSASSRLLLWAAVLWAAVLWAAVLLLLLLLPSSSQSDDGACNMSELRIDKL
jgi:hypothetical protein